MIREREDSGLWNYGRLKSIIPHGDICKGKISFQRCLHVISFSFTIGIFQHHITLLFALHPSKQIVFLKFQIFIICLLWSCCHQSQKGRDCKENGLQAHLLWILVFDDQHNQIKLMNLQVTILQFNKVQDVTWTKATW